MAGFDERDRAHLNAWIADQHAIFERASYYQVLGVARGASVAEVRDAYYRLVARFHPDLYGDALDGPTRAKLVTLYSRLVEAYRTLLDPARRAQYDRGLAAGRLRWSPDDDHGARREPEAAIANPHAKRFFKLGCAALLAGDARGAVLQLKLALSAEPTSVTIRAELARAESAARDRR